jgi:hypothetical protein
MTDDLSNLERLPLGMPNPFEEEIVEAPAHDAGEAVLTSPRTPAPPTDTEELQDQSAKGKFGRTWIKLSEYDIILGVAALALFVGCLFLFFEMWSYDFVVRPPVAGP